MLAIRMDRLCGVDVIRRRLSRLYYTKSTSKAGEQFIEAGMPRRRRGGSGCCERGFLDAGGPLRRVGYVSKPRMAADLPRGSGRLGDAPLPRRCGGFAPRIELAFGDSASLRGIRGKAGASEMRPYQYGATDLPRGSGGGVSAQCDATVKKTEATRFRRVVILPRGLTALAKCERPRNRCRHRLFRRSFAAYPRQS